MKYYNNEKEITMEEAHELKDKSGLIVADNPLTFKKEKVADAPNKVSHKTSKGGKK